MKQLYKKIRILSDPMHCILSVSLLPFLSDDLQRQ